ncbi:MAG: SDR family oxidoreductase [Betaproteobacteria bacterium]|jgi:NAD(P)-dependent dehydrogenase (short-subunit alcohol dehydrogenase family)|nr:SDR family oxidoreductase [Betaproteobacteria bacterium]
MASKSTQSAAPAKKSRKPAATRKSPTPSARAAAPSSQRTVAVSGSQSGLGLAIRQRLAVDGWRVIGIDLPGKGAEVEADLSSSAGRKKAVAGVLKQCGGVLHGVVANAGVDSPKAELTFQVNFFGVTELLEGLRPALARAERPAAVVTVSHAIAISPGIPDKAVAALLGGDMKGAEGALGRFTPNPYPVSKLALARWIRREAPGESWAGSGITLNGICPGPIVTPMLEHDLQDKVKGPIIRAMPKPTGETAHPADLAGLYGFLLGPDARYVVGQMLMADGGIESLWRGEDWPKAWPISAARFVFQLFAPVLMKRR